MAQVERDVIKLEVRIYKVSESVEVVVGLPREEDDHGIEHHTVIPLTFRFPQTENALLLDKAPQDLRQRIKEFYEKCLAKREKNDTLEVT